MEQKIKIEISNLDQYYREIEKKFVDHFYSFKTLIPSLICLVLGLTLLITGILKNYDVEVTTFKNGVEEISLYNFGMFIGLGCGLILFAILYSIDRGKSKKATKLLYSIKRNKEKRVNQTVEIELSEDGVCYTSSLNNWNKKWKYFDSYEIIQSNLNLYSKSYNLSFPELIIPLKELNSQQSELLKTLISSKLKNYS